MNEGISLYDLQKKIKGSIDKVFSHQIWVRGEISSVKENYSGHCYIDLVDKEDGCDAIRAKCQAIVWNSSWRVIAPYFQSTTGSRLEAGMKVLLKGSVQYSEIYGLSIVVSDIDPTFGIGEMELRRREVIARLEKEGMFDMNTTLKLPSLPRRFAIVSAEGAAGYRDFMKHLHENEFGFKFFTKLYSAPMQGDTAPGGIVGALDKIVSDVQEGEVYDAALIIRGGGSMLDLACFDDYFLCSNVAQFPLPVMVAVGHDQDYHICDMVSCISVKTPTALADYILDIFKGEAALVGSLASRLNVAMSSKFSSERSRLDFWREKMGMKVGAIVQEKLRKLDLMEQRIRRGDPRLLIQSGYSVVEGRGGRIHSASQISEGEVLDIHFGDGKAECVVKNVIRIDK